MTATKLNVGFLGLEHTSIKDLKNKKSLNNLQMYLALKGSAQDVDSVKWDIEEESKILTGPWKVNKSCTTV